MTLFRQIMVQVAYLDRLLKKTVLISVHFLMYATIVFAIVYIPISFYLILTGRLFGWTTVPDPFLVAEEIITGKIFTWGSPDVPRFLLDSTLKPKWPLSRLTN